MTPFARRLLITAANVIIQRLVAVAMRKLQALSEGQPGTALARRPDASLIQRPEERSPYASIGEVLPPSHPYNQGPPYTQYAPPPRRGHVVTMIEEITIYEMEG